MSTYKPKLRRQCLHCAANGVRASLQTVTTARGEVRRCWQCGGEYQDDVRVWPPPWIGRLA